MTVGTEPVPAAAGVPGKLSKAGTLASKLGTGEVRANLAELLNGENLLALSLTALRITVTVTVCLLVWRGINRLSVSLLATVSGRAERIGPKYHKSQSMLRLVVLLCRSVLQWIAAGITALVILSELAIDIAPILYSLGVFGLAFSIGAQTLVKDLINGLLTVFSGNIGVGDTVQIGGNKGTIEEITLRAVRLRCGGGETQVVPFSEIGQVINFSRGYKNNKISVLVSPKVPPDVIYEACSCVYNRIIEEEKYKTMVIDPFKAGGVESLSDNGIKVVANIRTTADPDNRFLLHFNKLLCEELQARNIEFAPLKEIG